MRPMHELSIALSILDLAEEEAARREARVLAIHLRLGPLSGVVREALVSAFELAREGTSQAATDLVVEEVPILVRCPACQAPRAIASPYELRCTVCGSPAPEVLQGRELEVVALEIDR
jgi:hydrogenase nickel incorporation protein HypA/HybF